MGRMLAAARIASAFATVVLLSACQTLAVTALGIGASAGVMHVTNSEQHRTFTAGPGKVKTAVLAALARMGLEVESVEKRDGIDVVKASGTSLDIRIELEPMSTKTTQLRATAKHNVLVHDAATALEIVEQTEMLLEAPGGLRRSAGLQTRMRAVVRDERP